MTDFEAGRLAGLEEATKVAEGVVKNALMPGENHREALYILKRIRALAGQAPCGGSRCHRAEDGTWIHSSKSYATCVLGQGRPE